jgi:hypothetical protein
MRSGQISDGIEKIEELQSPAVHNGGFVVSTLTIEGWCKISGAQKSTPLGDIHFYVDGPLHLRLEQAEERLQKTQEPEAMVDVDMSSMDLIIPEGYGPLSDCQMRVYLHNERGQFHLVGHRASDGSLIYSNAVLIDQLL